MKKQTQKIIGTTLIAIVLLVVLNGCETWRSECEGEIIVENPIPDTTLYVGGEPFERDLFEPPVVFRQTEGQHLTFVASSSDGTIASANGRRNSEGRITILEVTPKTEGNIVVTVNIQDKCSEEEINFSVSVQDTTNT